MTAAPMRTVAVPGLRTLGAESLAVRAGGLVFTGALGTRHGDGGDSWTHVARALEVLGCRPDQVGKLKAFLVTMEDAGNATAVCRSVFPAAAITAVGAGLPAGGGSSLLEAVGMIGDRPEVVVEHGAIVATRLGPLVLTAGCGPFAGDRLVGAGDLGAQGQQALERMCAALNRAGAGPDDLLKVNNTTSCWHDYRLYNAAYNSNLAGSSAARCSVSGALRDPLSLIEIEAIAAPGLDRRYVDSTRSGVGRDQFLARPDTTYLPDLGPCKGPHSHGARAGDLVFIAGECPYDAEDRLVGPGDVAAQTMRTLENVRLSLEALGGTLADVVKTSVTLSDARLIPAFERAYAEVFAPPYPARSLVATPLGQYGILVEMEAIAVIGAAWDGLAAVGGAMP
ncbi:RidA family protein [Lichenifustis flavocetrariae]|uniref:Rid family hydrolase n=1 Tax=Lichenifustis flavocetrariae TaxID=2949735 RepID=A0AA42CQV2_9HYPH|nr:RidA family protein [Lichenifustis flavocetrariae]MCW6511810.1 Rid family hydrolase [Lichenifustis flavocetrariae]